MTSQTLREARKYEEASEKMIKKEERPDFHLSCTYRLDERSQRILLL